MKPIDVLFLCETNAAVSLMAEAVVNHRGDPRIRAFSAGRTPADAMLPEARAALAAAALPADGLVPKSWAIFTLPGARRPDLVVDLATVTWTDPDLQKLTDAAILRWPLRDPALAESRRERRHLAEQVRDVLMSRIDGEILGRVAFPLVPGAAPAMHTMVRA
jgi:arsenate reductase